MISWLSPDKRLYYAKVTDKAHLRKCYDEVFDLALNTHVVIVVGDIYLANSIEMALLPLEQRSCLGGLEIGSYTIYGFRSSCTMHPNELEEAEGQQVEAFDSSSDSSDSSDSSERQQHRRLAMKRLARRRRAERAKKEAGRTQKCP